MRTALVKAVNSLLAEIREINPASNSQKDFAKKHAGQQLSGLFMFDGLPGILEERDYCSMSMVFSLSSHF